MIEIENPLENAYKTFPGPVLLLAGPGTGKTYQLAKRIKFLVEHEQMGAHPNEIAVITFTKEAARNMRGKLAEDNDEVRLERDKYPEIIATMHSLGNMIIGSTVKKTNNKGLIFTSKTSFNLTMHSLTYRVSFIPPFPTVCAV